MILFDSEQIRYIRYYISDKGKVFDSDLIKQRVMIMTLSGFSGLTLHLIPKLSNACLFVQIGFVIADIIFLIYLLRTLYALRFMAKEAKRIEYEKDAFLRKKYSFERRDEEVILVFSKVFNGLSKVKSKEIQAIMRLSLAKSLNITLKMLSLSISLKRPF